MTSPQTERVQVITLEGKLKDRAHFGDFSRDFIATGLSSQIFIIGRVETFSARFAEVLVRIKLRSTAGPVVDKAFSRYGQLVRWAEYFEITRQKS